MRAPQRGAHERGAPPVHTPLPMTSISWPDSGRSRLLHDWLASLPAALALRPDTLAPAFEASGLPRHLRLQRGDGAAALLLDAWPDVASAANAAAIARRMAGCGLQVPEVLAVHAAEGFVLLSDIAAPSYRQLLADAAPPQADRLMRAATQALLSWQTSDAGDLPCIDEAALRSGLQDFVDRCVQGKYGRRWSEGQQRWWERGSAALLRVAMAQPQRPVHGNFRCGHLLACEPGPGLLAFHGAAIGPLSWDLAMLLRDPDTAWQEEQELDWAIRYWEQARKRELLGDGELAQDFGEFWRTLEWTGLLQHLSLLGRLCRIEQLSGVPAPAQALGRSFAHAIKVSTRYVELGPLTQLLQDLRADLFDAGFELR